MRPKHRTSYSYFYTARVTALSMLTFTLRATGNASPAVDELCSQNAICLQLHQYEHIVDRANGVFEIPVAHADDDV